MDHPPSRVSIEIVPPAILGGRFPAKRTVGEEARVTAGIHADGYDPVRAAMRVRHEGKPEWRKTPLRPLVIDRGTEGFLPRIREELSALLSACLTETALHERECEPNIRPDRAKIPMRGILQLLETGE